MKRIISVFIGFVMIISTTACNSSTDTVSPEEERTHIGGYEIAEYDKFNSPASENGLDGTSIYIGDSRSNSVKRWS